jgi:phage gpG-like protein
VPRIDYKLGKYPHGDGLGQALTSSELTRALSAAAELQVAKLHRAFNQGGHHKGRGGERWEKLTPRYAIRKRKRGLTKILVVTGRLRRSIRQTTKSASNGNGIDTVFSADTPYASFHQSGTSRMVQRRVLVVTTKDEKEIRKAVKRAAKKILNGRV